MFFIKKIVTYLILPPGVFILIFIGSGLYLVRRHRRIGYLLIFSGVCLYALSIGPVKYVLMSPLENTFPVQANVSGDVIVILGSGIESEALSRFMCGHRLWKRLHVPVILTGCGEKGHEKRLLMEMGVDGQDIIEEVDSKDTFENGRHAKEIIEKRGFKSPILVTSAYHIKRAVFLFEKQGIKVEPFSCGLKPKEERDYDILDFLPRASVLEESSKALKEYMGLMAEGWGFTDPQISQINADLRISHQTPLCELRTAGRHTQTHTDICPVDVTGQKMVIASRKDRDQMSEGGKGQRSEVSRLRKATPCQGGREGTEVRGQMSEDGKAQKKGC